MRGTLGADENMRIFVRYLALLRSNGRALPAHAGAPNLSRIAADCGFDRGVFHTNNMVRELLADALRELGLQASGRKASASKRANSSLPNEAKLKTDARSRSIEAENIMLRADLTQTRAELAAARAEIARFGALKKLMAATGKMP